MTTYGPDKERRREEDNQRRRELLKNTRTSCDEINPPHSCDSPAEKEACAGEEKAFAKEKRADGLLFYRMAITEIMTVYNGLEAGSPCVPSPSGDERLITALAVWQTVRADLKQMHDPFALGAGAGLAPFTHQGFNMGQLPPPFHTSGQLALAGSGVQFDGLPHPAMLESIFKPGRPAVDILKDASKLADIMKESCDEALKKELDRLAMQGQKQVPDDGVTEHHEGVAAAAGISSEL